MRTMRRRFVVQPFNINYLQVDLSQQVYKAEQFQAEFSPASKYKYKPIGNKTFE